MGLVDIEFVVFRRPDPAIASIRDRGHLDLEERGGATDMRSSGDVPLPSGPDVPGL